MKHARRALAPIVATLLLALGVAAAHASRPGGVKAPSEPLSGGSEYGVVSLSPVHHPVVTTLTVPRTALPGGPPRVFVMIDETRAHTVYAIVVVHDLATHKPALLVRLGWIPTHHVLAVRWPRGARLAVGTYHVSVTAHDDRGDGIKRTAHSSGVVTLTVAAPARPPSLPTPAATPEPGVPTPAQTVADGAVFPVAGPHEFGGPENRYGAPRNGHIHEGQDVLAAEGTPNVAPLAGAITYTSYQAGGAGYYAVEHTLIGFDFMFAHCKAGSLAVAANQVVSAGQTLCLVGQTGDATAPHLHFEMWVGGWQAPGGHSIDPLAYLEAWEAAGH